MNCIYMHNYRGFSKTTMHFCSVNFFVGENSTGKTSILSLIELLSSPEFWLNFEFNSGSYEYGGFKDIVSADSDHQNEFQIGVYKSNEGKHDRSICYLLHFQQSKDGIPQLARISYLSTHSHVTIRLTEKQISGIANISISISDFSTPEKCFEYLQQEASFRKGYKIIEGKIAGYIRTAPIFNLPILINELTESKNIENEYPFSHFPGLTTSFAGLAPIRTKPKRTYDGYTKQYSSEGEHTPYVIRKRLPRSKSGTNAFAQALHVFGKDSGLFEIVGVKRFGKDSSAPFELTIRLGKKALRLNSVGYGVSQVLPIVVELLTHDKYSWLAIQQPEVHLHPKAQAALGDVLFQAAIDNAQTLVVETHSDYLLDRFRLNMRDTEQREDFAQVIYFERTSEGNQIHQMVLDSSGEYPNNQPTGFRNFFLLEHKRILGI